MKLKAALITFSTATLLQSCFLTRNSSDQDDQAAVIHLDTVEAVASTPAERALYRASATRTNDVIHTKLEVSFDYSKRYLYGKATITLRPYFYPVNSVQLDAQGMEIKEVLLVKNPDLKELKNQKDEKSAVLVSDQPAIQYTYKDNVLDIKLDRMYRNDEAYTLFISYVAKPDELKSSGGSAAISGDKGLYFINPEGKDPLKPVQVWTQGETQASSVWYPTIDRPNERMTQEIFMTVDKKYATLSNGELVASFDNNDGTRTDHWKMELPFAPYLSMMAIGDFAVVKDNKWRGREVNYYVEKEYEPHAKAIFGNTPEMLEFYSNLLGVEYPWNKYSQIVVRDYVSGAMENVTATLHGEFLQQTTRELLDSDHESIIAHELFHQWFGDLVTCESWSNLPLNESFATYGEYLWIEHKYGRDAADEHSAQSRVGYFAESSRKQVDMIRFNYEDQEDMFDAHSYNKGGQILHMLRKYVGDEAFFASLKLYLETNKFKSVEIHQLRLAFEEVTGEDLNWFFEQWFLSSGHPDIIINKSYDADKKIVKVNIRQVQDLSRSPLFKIPMAVDIYSNGTAQRHKITVNSADDTFELPSPSVPDWVNVDADKMLLCSKSEQKPLKEWIYQYNNGKLYLDRSVALEELGKQASDSLAALTIISALSDRFEGIRSTAITMLKDLPAGHSADIKQKLVALAKVDSKATVRASAMEYLVQNMDDADLQDLYKKGLNDQSYSVIGVSLSGIAKADAAEALRLAKAYENEKSVSMLFPLADLYSTYGTDEHNAFFIRSAPMFTGFGKIGFVTLYTTFLKRVKAREPLMSGVQLLANIASDPGNSKWVGYYAKKSLRDLAAMYDESASFVAQKIRTQKETNPSANTRELEEQQLDHESRAKEIRDISNNLK
jgi:aminopeptidase N